MRADNVLLVVICTAAFGALRTTWLAGCAVATIGAIAAATAVYAALTDIV